MGFKFREEMAGRFEAGDGRTGTIRFVCRASADSLLRHLKDHHARLEGKVDMEGIATGQPLDGSIEIDPLLGRKIRYHFTFRGDDGKAYRFEGQKDVTPFRPIGSMTTLPARVLDDATGAEYARATLHFDMGPKNVARFLGSFRPL